MMNSFNHYAYGACSEWMFGSMLGIETDGVQVTVLIILREVRLLSLEKSFQVALSFRLLRTALELDKVRDGDRGLNADDRDDGQQLDEREAVPRIPRS